jgi:hypothetical protein
MGERSVFLVGMMGAGKTTLGKSLAQRLVLDFVDTDKVLVERTGVPIATIFEIEGEAGFRRRETAVIAELARGKACVVATGEVRYWSPDNRRTMRENGTVIYLARAPRKPLGAYPPRFQPAAARDPPIRARPSRSCSSIATPSTARPRTSSWTPARRAPRRSSHASSPALREHSPGASP